MEVKYRPNFWEFVWFNFYQMPRTLSTQIIIAAFIIWAGYNEFQNLANRDYPLVVKILTFIIIVLFWLLFGIVLTFLFIAFLQLTSQHQRSLMNHDCTLIVSEAGVVNVSPTKRTELDWAGIPKISQTRGSILVYVSDASAFVISKKSFPTEANARAFFDYTYNLWKSSRNAVPSK